MLQKVKKNINLLSITVIAVALIVILIVRNVLVINELYLLDDDVRYNLITINAIIAGFLFTGLSLVFSLTEKARIRRLEQHGYFDELYNVIFAGILAHLASIVSSIIILFGSVGVNKRGFAYLEMGSMLIGFLLFIYSVFFLKRIIKLLRNRTE